ncbi:MAG: hypothetical protein U1A78_33150 [Polyangia bacterium]
MEQVPSIADKVRFWQEQDQINQTLIPRVIKLHDTVAELSRQLEGTPSLLATLEARLRAQAIEENRKITERALKLGKRLEQQAEDLSKLRVEMNDKLGNLQIGLKQTGTTIEALDSRLDAQFADVIERNQKLADDLTRLSIETKEDKEILATQQSNALSKLEARLTAQETELKAWQGETVALQVTHSRAEPAVQRALPESSYDLTSLSMNASRLWTTPPVLISLFASIIALASALFALAVLRGGVR